MINTGRDDAICDIGKVEAKYNAKWVGQLPLHTVSRGWSEDNCGDVYYQETPPHGYSNYFALIFRHGGLYITSAATAVIGSICGVKADDGEIIYSRYRHDYRTSKDKSVFVDGGRDYLKTNAVKSVELTIVKGEWKINE